MGIVDKIDMDDKIKVHDKIKPLFYGSTYTDDAYVNKESYIAMLEGICFSLMDKINKYEDKYELSDTTEYTPDDTEEKDYIEDDNIEVEESIEYDNIEVESDITDSEETTTDELIKALGGND